MSKFVLLDEKGQRVGPFSSYAVHRINNAHRNLMARKDTLTPELRILRDVTWVLDTMTKRLDSQPCMWYELAEETRAFILEYAYECLSKQENALREDSLRLSILKDTQGVCYSYLSLFIDLEKRNYTFRFEDESVICKNC